MNWLVLGIEPTKDKKAIRAAYKEKLTSVNPEERPEEFMELRAAYEEALKLAAQEEEPDEEKSDLDLWVEKLSALYFDFTARLDVACWKELMSDEVCIGLDTRPEVERRMIQFFLENFRVPQNVWLYLDSEFDFRSRIQELYESYPKDFVDFIIIEGIRSKEEPPFELFEPGRDGAACDRYLELYHKMTKGGVEGAKTYREELLALPEQHPYGRAYLAQVDVIEGDENGIAVLGQLYEQYPEDDVLAYNYASTLFNQGKVEEAEKVAKEVYSEREYYRMGALLGRCLAEQKRFDEATNMVDGLYNLAEGNPALEREVNELSAQWNEGGLQELKEKVEADPENYDLRYEYLISLCRAEHYEEADEQLSFFPEGKPDEYGYCNMHSRSALRHNDYEQAYEFLVKQLEAGKRLVPDGTSITENRIANLANVRLQQGVCLEQLGRKEEALAIFDECLAEKPDDVQTLQGTIYPMLRLNEYGRAVSLAEHLMELQPANAAAASTLANTYYCVGQDRASLDATERWIALDGSNLLAYLLKMRIFLRNGVTEGVEGTASFLLENGVPELPVIRWCKAAVSKEREEDKPGLIPLYEELDQQIQQEGEQGDWVSEFYYDYARLYADVSDQKVTDNNYAAARPRIIELLDKGLAAYSKDERCLDYKAWLLGKDGKNEEALEIYEYLKLVPGSMQRATRSAADIYFKNLGKNAEKAYKNYNALLQQNPEDPVLLYYTGMCLFYMNDLEGAADKFLREEIADPEDVDGFHRLSMVRTVQERLEEALEEIDKAIAVATRNNNKPDRFYHHKIRILRKMGRYTEAMQVAEEYAAINNKYNPFSVKNDILLQSGDYEGAKKNLKLWHKAYPRDSEMRKEQILLYYMAGENVSAKLHWDNYNQLLDQSEKEAVEIVQAMRNAAAGSAMAKRISLNKMKSFLERAEKNNFDHWISVASKYLEACYMYGEQEKTTELAEKYLRAIKQRVSENSLCRAIEYTRLVYAYTFVGDEEKAREALALVDKEHLCDFCVYNRCKDRDLAEIRVEIVFGDAEKALARTEELMAQWPDESDFQYMKTYLERKMKKNANRH